MGGRHEARCKSNFKDVDRIDSVIQLAAKEARARTYRVYGVEGLGFMGSEGFKSAEGRSGIRNEFVILLKPPAENLIPGPSANHRTMRQQLA